MRRYAAQVIAYAAAAIGGIVLWGAFPPADETLNAIIALAPLLIIARLSTPRKAAVAGFIFGLAFWVPTLIWMLALTDNNGPWFAVVPAWLGLSAWCSVWAAIFAALDARLWRLLGVTSCRFLLPLGEAVLWAGCEWLRAHVFSGFSWNTLGVAFATMPYFIAPAKFGGAYLISALIVLFNGVAATLVIRAFAGVLPNVVLPFLPCTRFARFAETALPLTIILVFLWAGKIYQGPVRGMENPIRISLLQRNASCTGKQGPRENPHEAFGNLADVAAVSHPDMILSAESAMCEFGEARSRGALSAATMLLAKTGAQALVAGADERVAGKVYNAAALYRCDGSEIHLSATYRKNHLVPFGEYIPLDKTFPWLGKFSPVGVSLWSGEPTLLRPFGEDGLRLGVLICFEDTVPELACQAAKDGAQMIALITNDAWFTPKVDGPIVFLRGLETIQHVRQTVLRAVETGLPILRVGNSGVTGIIYPSGKTRFLEEEEGVPLVDRPGVMTEAVRPVRTGSSKTPYVLFKDWPLLIIFILVVGIIFGVPKFVTHNPELSCKVAEF